MRYIAALIVAIHADLPIHCRMEDVAGSWIVHSGPPSDSFVDCGYSAPNSNARNLELKSEISMKDSFLQMQFPSSKIISLNDDGKVSFVDNKGDQQQGSWTMVYDEGVEIRVANSRYFAFFDYSCTMNSTKCNKPTEETDEGATPGFVSDCGATLVGWASHGSRFGCWHGSRVSRDHKIKSFATHRSASGHSLSRDELNEMSHTRNFRKYRFTNTTNVAPEVRRPLLRGSRVPRGLPRDFDWRQEFDDKWNVPVINQGSCGSCYAIAATYALQSRFRIALLRKGIDYPVNLSAQSVLDCGYYSQGCDGGFPFLVGRHAHDIGLVEEECLPYMANAEHNAMCDGCGAARWYAKDYGYVGGHFGAATEASMMKSLYHHGPLAVGIDATAKFLHAQARRIFEDKDVGGHPGEWEFGNHAMVLVGWGESEEGPYWWIRNSWGQEFAESGYVRILRGNDTAAIESLVTYTVPDIDRLEKDTNGFKFGQRF